ncbi:MAG TPA: DUF5063 domain-containing protein [Burkholderiaceae bacterium]
METATTSAATATFAALARAFCAWCEAASPDPDAATRAAAWIARLHAAALALPEVGCDYFEELPEPPEAALRRARANLGAFDGWYYREVFDPDPTLDDRPVMGDVGDDLTDIWLDVRQGLIRFEQGHVREALWHWSYLHRIHWGRHAVGALFALHCRAARRTSP